MKTKIRLLSSLLFVAFTWSSRAIPIEGTFNAVVWEVTAPPGFGVQVGDSILGQFGYDTDYLSPPDAHGNRVDGQPQDHFDMSAYFVTDFTWGTLWERNLSDFVIGPNGEPVDAYSINQWYYGSYPVEAYLSGTSLVISGPLSDDGNSEVIQATVTSYNGVPDAGSSIGLMGLAMSALMVFRSFTRHLGSQSR